MSLQQALFSPRSVAVVGQSDDAGKTAGRPLKFLRQMGYAGRIYPINPRRETVLGERAWPSLTALPEPPDHVYVVTPTSGRRRSGRGMRAARRQGGDRAGRRLRRGRRRRRGAGDAAARRLRAHRAAHRRAVEPRHRRPAQQGDADRERRLRRDGIAGRPHLRRLALRQPDRRAAHPRQGARRRLRGPGFGRQRGRPLARRHLRGDAR